MRYRAILFSVAVGFGACGSDSPPPPAPPPPAVLPPPVQNLAPTLELHDPGADLTSFRGGSVAIRYLDQDPEGSARTTLVADRDGDVATTGDQLLIARDRPTTGSEQTAFWTTTGVPPGTYFVLGSTTDDEGLTADAIAAGVVTVVDLPAPLRIGGPDYDYDARVATFADGSTAMAAYGAGPIEIDGTTIGGQRGTTIFLVRHDNEGAPVWAKEIVAGNAAARVRGVAAFADGSTVAVGMIYSESTFGAGEPNETTFDESGMFVARYDADGALQWARLAAERTNRTGTLYRVAAAADGSCIVAGSFFEPISFGGGVTLTATGANELFVARYAADGTLLWARHGGGPALAADIDCGPAGDCVIVGHTEVGATFGAENVTNADGLAEPGTQAFVARFRSDGTLEWLRSFGGQSLYEPAGVSLFADGSCVVTTTLRIGATFGAGEPNETRLESSGTQAVLAKYSRAGALEWARTAATATTSVGHAVVTTPDGGTALVGYMGGTEGSFEREDGTQLAIPIAGPTDGFLAEFDADGALVAARSLGGGRLDDATDVARFEDGSLVVAGWYDAEIAIPPAGPLVSAGHWDIYLAWLAGGG